MLLLILEFIGTQELLLIMVVALVFFGPRKVPELGRSLGKSLNQFKRASEDFKRTWEQEVDIERAEKQAQLTDTSISEPSAQMTFPEVRETDAFDVSTSPAKIQTTNEKAGIESEPSPRTAFVAETIPRESRRVTPSVVHEQESATEAHT